MPRYYGPAMAAGALGNALSEMFTGMLQGQENRQKAAEQLERLKATQWQTASDMAKFPEQMTQTKQGLEKGALEMAGERQRQAYVTDQQAREAGRYDIEKGQFGLAQERGTREAAEERRKESAESRAMSDKQRELAFQAEMGALLNAPHSVSPMAILGVLAKYGKLGPEVPKRAADIALPDPQRTRELDIAERGAVSKEIEEKTKAAESAAKVARYRADANRLDALAKKINAEVGAAGEGKPMTPAQEQAALSRISVQAERLANDFVSEFGQKNPGQLGTLDERREALRYIIDDYRRELLQRAGPSMSKFVEAMGPRPPLRPGLRKKLGITDKDTNAPDYTNPSGYKVWRVDDD